MRVLKNILDNKLRWFLGLCLVWLAGSIIMWQLSSYVLAHSQDRIWKDFNAKVQKSHQVKDVPYAGLINAYSAKAGLDPQLVASVIRAESSFRPQVVSAAKAYGLMQVLPETWQDVNNEIHAHEGPVTVEQLTDPELNIYIGTTYFKHLLTRFHGNAVLALAAYNAGPKAVEDYKGIPPFTETEEYVGRIIDYWYAMVGEQEPPPFDKAYWFDMKQQSAYSIIACTVVVLLAIWQKVAVRLLRRKRK